MKILHFADLHIHLLKRHDEYRTVLERIVNIIKQEKPDVVVFAGDFCHSKINLSPELIDIVVLYLKSIADLVPFYIIPGNHDGNLNNKSRQDSLSPIVAALNHPNVFFYKNSSEVELNDNFVLNFLSPFDEENWNEPSDPDKVNIAVFHGPIKGCQTDIGWYMNSCYDSSILDKFDYALLGDIHLYQSVDLKGKKKYSGGTIQGNFGEQDDKGVLLWDIKDKDNFTCRHIVIPNPKPYITITLEEDGSVPKKLKIPKKARIRVVSQSEISLETLHKSLDIVKARYSPESLSFLSSIRKNVINNQSIDDVPEENLRNQEVQEKHIREYLKSFELDEDSLRQVFELNEKYNKEIKLDEDIERGVHWSLGKIEWDNLYNYGEKNYIDFSKLNGIVGLLGNNKIGKSSAIDSMTYALFNTASKNNRKSLNIINQNKDSGCAKINLNVGPQQYEIFRKSEKYVKKLKGIETQEAKTTVDFSLTEPYELLNGDDRNETDKNIRRLFGTLDDFLLTSFSSQHGSLSYINEGSTKRKEILARFLDLQMFEEKFNLAKSDAAGLKASLKRFDDKDFITDIARAEVRKESLEEDIQKSEELVELLKKTVDELRSKLTTATVKLSGYSEIEFIDIDTLNKEKEAVIKSIETNQCKIDEIQQKINQNNQLLTKIKEFLKDFDVAEHENKIDFYNETNRKIEQISQEIHKYELEVSTNERKTNLLKEVPCGPEFSSCKFIKDAYVAVSVLPGLKEKVRVAKENKSNLEQLLDKESFRKSKEYIQKHKDILDRKNNAERKFGELLSSLGPYQYGLLSNQRRLEEIESSICSYEQSIESQRQMKDLKEEIETLEQSLKKSEKEFDKADKEYKKQLGDLGSYKQEVLSLRASYSELLKLRKDYSVYEMFMRCMHPNGISYEIIKKKLPIINAEIARVLTNVADFEVFFVDDEDKLELFIKHPAYDPRVIEMGSGAEKSLAAMAIRLALFGVTTLPKSDIMILDEPAVDLDPESMESFIQILDLLRNNFRLILLISHLDVLKDCVDSQIQIEKVNGYARIQI